MQYRFNWRYLYATLLGGALVSTGDPGTAEAVQCSGGRSRYVMGAACATIKNFRRFTDLTVLGIPKKARLIMFAGPNGCGKSCFFTALHTWYNWTTAKLVRRLFIGGRAQTRAEVHLKVAL